MAIHKYLTVRARRPASERRTENRLVGRRPAGYFRTRPHPGLRLTPPRSLFFFSSFPPVVHPRRQDSYTMRARTHVRAAVLSHPADARSRARELYGKRVIVWEFSEPRLMKRLEKASAA
ncbi:hypothetical protein PUN28_012389 [Cardiocondyla obscurior]|uniref:Uncharacterized protein n=1 Tax=Cardiocondyla obscurior TaxID=286306 RepID=A0AAW2FDR9_9HYME